MAITEKKNRFVQIVVMTENKSDLADQQIRYVHIVDMTENRCDLSGKAKVFGQEVIVSKVWWTINLNGRKNKDLTAMPKNRSISTRPQTLIQAPLSLWTIFTRECDIIRLFSYLLQTFCAVVVWFFGQFLFFRRIYSLYKDYANLTKYVCFAN